MDLLQKWELASYIVTVFGFPAAISVFFIEQARERETEEEEIYQRLSDEYAEFSKVLLKNSDLQLMSRDTALLPHTAEQLERKKIIFDILVALFERAFIIVYEDQMSKQQARLWASWDDYMRFWCARHDFRESLPELLTGEDPDFGEYIRKIATEMKKN